MGLNTASLVFMLILVLAVVGGPVIVFAYQLAKTPLTQRLELARTTSGWPTISFGIVITAAGGATLTLFAFGFLFPGLGWTSRNALSDTHIWIRGKGRAPGQWIRPEDVDLTLFLTALATGVAIFGALVVWSGWRNQRLRRSLTAAPSRPTPATPPSHHR